MAPVTGSTADGRVEREAGGARTIGEGDLVAVWLWGEHDVSTQAVVGRALGCAIDEHERDVVVDLRDVEFLDASTVGSLITARNMLAGCGRRLSLRSPGRSPRRVLEVCGLTDLIHPDTANIPQPGRGVPIALETRVEVSPTGRSADESASTPPPTRTERAPSPR